MPGLCQRVARRARAAGLRLGSPVSGVVQRLVGELALGVLAPAALQLPEPSQGHLGLTGVSDAQREPQHPGQCGQGGPVIV